MGTRRQSSASSATTPFNSPLVPFRLAQENPPHPQHPHTHTHTPTYELPIHPDHPIGKGNISSKQNPPRRRWSGCVCVPLLPLLRVRDLLLPVPAGSCPALPHLRHLLVCFLPGVQLVDYWQPRQRRQENLHRFDFFSLLHSLLPPTAIEAMAQLPPAANEVSE